jgi:ABC-type uncharacterized transport system permease subunit
VFSYGVFALLALTSLLYLLRNHSLRSKQLGGWFSFLPSIMDLDQIGRRLLGAGVAILTASLAIISIFWLRNPGSAAAVKILFTVAVWAVADGHAGAAAARGTDREALRLVVPDPSRRAAFVGGGGSHA